MKFPGKKIWLALLAVTILLASLVGLQSCGPYYRGRPVAQWAVDYSKKLYPSGTSPLSPSQQGLQALRAMGPKKAATALIQALSWRPSPIYERYCSIYPRFPPWYRNQFPLGLSYQDRVKLILGAADFLDRDYQTGMVPFIAAHLDKSDLAGQLAACQLLATMPAVGSPALPSLKRLSASADLWVSQAAQNAINQIGAAKSP